MREPIHVLKGIQQKAIDKMYKFQRLYQNLYIMEYSMLKTFGMKYRAKVSKIKKRYVRNGHFGVDYMTKDRLKPAGYNPARRGCPYPIMSIVTK